MANCEVGRSSYGSLSGVMQYVTSQHVADQFNSLALEFDTQVAKNGDRLTVNEGVRSRARQAALYQAWETYKKNGNPFATLAANPYTSTHDSTRGSALDVGVTSATGVNRAPTADEWAWIHSQGVKRGIRWTGQSFNPREEWHHNGGYAEILPPYPNVRIAGSPLPATTPVGDIMNTRIKRIQWPNQAYRSYLVNIETFKAMPLTGQNQEDYWHNSNVPLDKDVQPPWILNNFDIVTGKGAN